MIKKVEDIDDVIDSKLNQKIKEQINEINELQETINKLKDGQPIVSVCTKITILYNVSLHIVC